ncbi:MAG: hypothetical protein OXI97_05285 [Acidimicrobiaceae bacterium]|nr:hypothetical protein [Acidimicrobiaceae bacterium]
MTPNPHTQAGAGWPRRLPVRIGAAAALAVAVWAVLASPVGAQEAAADVPMTSELEFVLNSFALLVWGALVMWMCAGFTMLEAGSVRTKNSSMICLKNIGIYSIATLAFFFVGYNIMYVDVGSVAGSFTLLYEPLDAEVALIGGDASPSVLAQVLAPGSSHIATWLFQMLFVATTASVVSGAMLERTKLSAFWLFTLVLTALIYPIAGSWVWGGGWLEARGFLDFAGGTVVHSVGGAAALAGVIVVGPRRRKFRVDGTAKPTPPSNVLVVTLGVLILWLGWFGFNAGSQGALASARDVATMGTILVNTNLAAAAGMLAAVACSRPVFGRLGLAPSLNGALAGLVSVTAGPAYADHYWAVIIGGLAGVLCTLATWLLERMRLDDVVGAVPVHLVGGVWGTLAAAVTSDAELATQALGAAAVFAFVFIASFVVWKIIDVTVGVRISPQVEFVGQDVAELGIESHPEYVLVPEDRDGYGPGSFVRER